MYYTYLGISASGDHQYRVTLKLYRDCFSAGAQLDAEAAIAIFNKATGNAMVWNDQVPDSKTIERLQLGSPGACITNAPIVCYEVGYYEFTVTLTCFSIWLYH